MMQLLLFIIILIPVVIYVLNSKDKDTILKKIGYVFLGFIVLYLLVIMIQPKESIVYTDTTISKESN